MGRRKIDIAPIKDERSRQVTFTKRKNGLMKKAMELAILCNCRIGLIIFDCNGKVYDFKTEEMPALVSDYFSCDVHESNDKDELYHRYNTKEIEQAAADPHVDVEGDPKSEPFLADTEKTDETFVEVESNSDGNVDMRHADPNPKLQGQSKRRKIRTPSPTQKRERNCRQHEQLRHTNEWSAFAGRSHFVPESGYNNSLNPSSLFERRFKEEPYSAAQQQILCLEDIPPFLMSIPRQVSDYGMSVPTAGAECPRRQDSLCLNNGIPTSRPIFFVDNPNCQKILDICDSRKQPHLSQDLLTLPDDLVQQQLQSLAGQSPFSYFESVPDARHAHLATQYLESGLAHNALNDPQQDALFLQNILRSAAPSYNFPPSSHNPQS